ncbi:MAG: dTMP kinase [Alphaproteobacteria bacterium]
MTRAVTRGLFIVLEGIDGSGKSHQAKQLKNIMVAKQHQVLLTQEPQKKSLGKWVRDELLGDGESGKNSYILDDMAMLYLLLAARADHVTKTILPALLSGQCVICDRFMHSTLAYQGYGGGLDIGLIKNISQPIMNMIKPDRVFLLDIDVAIAVQRLEKSRDKKDAMEKKSFDFFEKVRKGFLSLAKQENNVIKIIDGSLPEDEITQIMEKNISDLLEK